MNVKTDLGLSELCLTYQILKKCLLESDHIV